MKLKNKLVRKYMIFFYRIIFVHIKLNPIRFLKGYVIFIIDLFKYESKLKNEKIKIINLYPQIYEKTETTEIDKSYFYQDTWAASKIFHDKPAYHVDIGSTALLVGILAQFTNVCSVDIRPLDIQIKGLECKKGSITKLPFKDKSIHSLSSLCVLEHIGLGRYGDQIDPESTNKAIIELIRVLAHDGSLYISVPIDKEDTIYFNAHKSFEVNNFIKRFHGMELIEVKYISKGKLYNQDEYLNIDFSNSATGLFYFKKNNR